MKKSFFILLMTLSITVLITDNAFSQQFIHPGIYQTNEDLEYMKKQVLAGTQPWKDAFDRLKTATDLDFVINPHAHVKRGSYGRPNIGGDDLRSSANMAYDCALLWYITEEREYAQKAIEIINAWSNVLWDLDYNDAKLLAGWTGHLFCNAAEILRYTGSGWEKDDIDQFTNMLMTVYYPLLRYYFPQANGNWDGAIIHSILAIAVFTDNREMFDNAINHFLYGPVNGSIFKYIWPSGQCQETTRDQAHVQLGLGEFAGAARIAYTQGLDLFSIANNRIALGFEYTASFLMGEKPHSYGVISERAKNIRDDYEYVYRHYSSKGLRMPFTKMAADSIRSRTSRSALTAFRAPRAYSYKNQGILQPSGIGFPAGAMGKPTSDAPADVIMVNPGESLQNALNTAAGTGRWVFASAGLHTLPATLKIPSGVTLAGEGISTVLFLDPRTGAREAIINEQPDMHDVTIRDLVVEGAVSAEIPSDPNHSRSYRSNVIRGGIMFLAEKRGQMKNITLQNITVQNCTWNGVFINGANNLKIIGCDFNESGSSVVPGPKLQHNLLLTHCSGVDITGSRFATSPHGSGIAVAHCEDVSVLDNEIARNAYYGVLITESSEISIIGNLIENNDRSGIMAEYLHRGSENITVTDNLIHYNKGYGIETSSVRSMTKEQNTLKGNKSGNQLSAEERIIMK